MSQYNVCTRRTKVARSEKIHPSYVVLHVENPGGAPCRPGQFAMLRLPGRGSEPFMLSRPFSIMDGGDRLLFLIRIVGKGSGLLASLRAGDELDMVSPLGSAFPDLDRAGTALCVAGGCGIAPFLFLARREKERGKPLRLLYWPRTTGARAGRGW
jgi:dihydroorotate dehydrogenase electron transfer subunit